MMVGRLGRRNGRLPRRHGTLHQRIRHSPCRYWRRRGCRPCSGRLTKGAVVMETRWYGLTSRVVESHVRRMGLGQSLRRQPLGDGAHGMLHRSLIHRYGRMMMAIGTLLLWRRRPELLRGVHPWPVRRRTEGTRNVRAIVRWSVGNAMVRRGDRTTVGGHMRRSLRILRP